MFEQKTPDRYIKVGSVNTRYRRVGQGSTVLLLHGLGSCADFWAPNIEVLAQHHQVYALDMVGFGRSDKPPGTYSFDYLAEFVNDFMKSAGIQRTSIIGISAGGAVALKIALKFPEKLDKLVLVSSGGLTRKANLGFRLATLPFIGEILTLPTRLNMTLLTKQAVYDLGSATDDLVELFYQMNKLPGAQQAILQLLRTNANLWGWRGEFIDSIVNHLDSITAPTLIIWGKQDRLAPVVSADIAAGGIPNARLHIFDKCGHCSSLEYAEEFNTLVCEFLA